MAILLTADGATATNGVLADFIDKLDQMTIEQIWTKVEFDGREWGGWWQVFIPVASALGSVLSLMVAARIAYRTMAEGKKIDVLALFRPLAFALVCPTGGSSPIPFTG